MVFNEYLAVWNSIFAFDVLQCVKSLRLNVKNLKYDSLCAKSLSTTKQISRTNECTLCAQLRKIVTFVLSIVDVFLA